jgi:hypothetical protein
MYKYFRERQEAYGKDQALRSVAIEDHTIEALLKIIEAHNLTDAVDLVSWGHNELFLTREEETVAEGDLKAAKEAGVNVDSVEILTKQMMDDVSIFMRPLSFVDPVVTEIWDTLSMLPIFRTQPLAFKTRY